MACWAECLLCSLHDLCCLHCYLMGATPNLCCFSSTPRAHLPQNLPTCFLKMPVPATVDKLPQVLSAQSTLPWSRLEPSVIPVLYSCFTLFSVLIVPRQIFACLIDLVFFFLTWVSEIFYISCNTSSSWKITLNKYLLFHNWHITCNSYFIFTYSLCMYIWIK